MFKDLRGQDEPGGHMAARCLPSGPSRHGLADADAVTHHGCVPRIQRKSFEAPDEVRRFPLGEVDIVHLDENVLGRFRFQPGWRWSVNVAPIAGTSSCQHRHFGYVISGLLHAVMDDGTELDIMPGDGYEIPPGHDAWVVGDTAWEAVESSSVRTFGMPPDASDERILATVLFTDIVDSTAMLSRLGDTAWQRLLMEHNDRLRAELDRFRGREIVNTGDGFLAVFDGAARAVRCAAAMAATVHGLGIHIRAGLHTGEVTLAGGNARGVAVHAAARVAALAGPDEVLVTSTTHDSADGSDLEFNDLGSHELKGLSGPRQVWALRAAGVVRSG
jgi:class 3 adenylate cyclase